MAGTASTGTSAGGAGDDTIDGKADDDFLIGDEFAIFRCSDPSVFNAALTRDGNDVINAGFGSLGRSYIAFGENDWIYCGRGNDLLDWVAPTGHAHVNGGNQGGGSKDKFFLPSRDDDKFLPS